MKIYRIAATDVMPFKTLDMRLFDGLTVVAGPNGSGKTSLGRVLDLVSRAVLACVTGDWNDITSEYGEAGRYGARRWKVCVELTFDADDEVSLLDNWARAALAASIAGADQALIEQNERLLNTELGAAEVLGSGELVVEHDGRRQQPWMVVWRASPAGGDVEMDLSSGNRIGPYPSPAKDASLHSVIDWLRQKEDSLAAPSVEAGPSTATLIQMAQSVDFELVARTSGGLVESPCTQRVLDRLGPMPLNRTVLTLSQVYSHLLASGLLVTANRRHPIRTMFSADDLTASPDLISGSGLALALWQDKNGDAVARTRFAETRDIFTALTDVVLDVQTQPIKTTSEESQLLLAPIVSEALLGDIPLRLAGAGREEAAFLAALLSRPRDVLVVDEPATNLSAAAQRRLLSRLRLRSIHGQQTIVITHSAHLVPARTPADLASIVRLTRNSAGTTVHRPSATPADFSRLRTLLRPADVRDLLFASGVVLLEGQTEREAFEVWLASPELGLPTVEDKHVVLMSVDGHKGFAAYVRLLGELGVPWAAVADGPAFRAGGPLDDIDGAPAAPSVPDTFIDAIARWRAHGVFTLASDFHDDRSKKGEIEAFFERTDAPAWRMAKSRGKVRQGAQFAAAVPVPAAITALWSDILAHLGQ